MRSAAKSQPLCDSDTFKGTIMGVVSETHEQLFERIKTLPVTQQISEVKCRIAIDHDVVKTRSFVEWGTRYAEAVEQWAKAHGVLK